MQENHGLYANRIEPIHLMTKVTSVLCTIYKKEKYDLIKQLADNLILTIDENITPEDIYISPVGCYGIVRRKQERNLNINSRLE